MKNEPVALVTGGARRIGAAIVRALHGRGFTVIIHYHHSADEAEALAAELNRARNDSALCLQADLCEPQAVSRLAENCLQLGRLDALICNASAFAPEPDDEQQIDEHWKRQLGPNLYAPYLLAHRLGDTLQNSAGCIVNISDQLPASTLISHQAYSAAKGGLNLLTRSLALALAPSVRVNAVAPGLILWPENPSPDQATRQRLLARVPAACSGAVEDIAAAVIFLVTSASYITGQLLTVDGGRQLLS